ncbi:MAG: rRNA pseudouridine synthase, partial [Actinomycetota bacterium]|nr:rRNA pseudouridine synthase [Actinomycetota bacterium]
LGSRRSVETVIAHGRVTVNGQRAVLGTKVDPSKDRVEVDGSYIPLQPELIYLLMNKPAGVVTTTADPEGRETVLEVIEAEGRVWPVGRLDIATEGALVVTNDGELTHRLTHPSFGIAKTYLAEVGGNVSSAELKTLARGVELSDGVTAPATVHLLDRRPGATLVEITIREGRNRQVRRMFEATGHRVQRLVRTAIGPVALGRLKTGTARRLTPEEVRALYRA